MESGGHRGPSQESKFNDPSVAAGPPMRPALGDAPAQPGRPSESVRDDGAPVLQVSDLQTHFFTFGGTRVVKAVDGVSFALHAGETLGLVGESGSGKTTTCLSIVGLLPRAARIVGGSVIFEGEELTTKSQRELRRIRGRRIAVILQDPMASLNPLFPIFRQAAAAALF